MTTLPPSGSSTNDTPAAPEPNQLLQDVRFFCQSLTSSVLGRNGRVDLCAAYVAGLTLPNPRNTISSIARRFSVKPRALQHFVNCGEWDGDTIFSMLRSQLRTEPRREPGILVLDFVLVPRRRSDHSTGVERFGGDWARIWNRWVKAERRRPTIRGQLAVVCLWSSAAGVTPVAAGQCLWAKEATGTTRHSSASGRFVTPNPFNRIPDSATVATRLLGITRKEVPSFRAVVVDGRVGSCRRFMRILDRAEVPYILRTDDYCDSLYAPDQLFTGQSKKLDSLGRRFVFLRWCRTLAKQRDRWQFVGCADEKGRRLSIYAIWGPMTLVRARMSRSRCQWLLILAILENGYVWEQGFYVSNLPKSTATDEFADILYRANRSSLWLHGTMPRTGIGHFEGRSARGFDHHLALGLLACRYHLRASRMADRPIRFWLK